MDGKDVSDGVTSKKSSFNQQKVSGKAWGVLQFRKLRSFPFSVLFIVGNEFCERFSYYGMRAVLVLFLLNQLDFSENSSTAIYHGFIVLCYLLPLVGAFISDSCLGKYRTILILSVVYGIGNIVVSISAVPFDNLNGINIALMVIGLITIALGTGGIKPCVSAFGGDQFEESQTDMLRRFFSLFYFSINAGSVVSTLLTPVLRSYVQCFGTCECFALAFGIPALLMFLSLVLFILGTRYYIIKKPQKEASLLYFNVPVSIVVAFYRRIRLGKIPGKKLLHYASPTYDVDFMNDVGLFLRVLVMFLPLPIFWTLFDQQGSRWTLQANRMDGRIGKFAIQPDQMQALNPILILVFIPIFETIVYPLFGKCHLLKRPLQRMIVGMVLAGLAFVVAGFVQFKVQAAQDTLNSDESKLVLFNSAPFPIEYHFSFDETEASNQTLDNGESCDFPHLESGPVEMMISSIGGSLNHSFELHEMNITQLFITYNNELNIVMQEYPEYIPEGGESSIQVINFVEDSPLSVIIKQEGSASSTECDTNLFNASELIYSEISDRENITFGRYEYILASDNKNESSSFKEEFEGGAVYSIIVKENVTSDLQKYDVTVVLIDPPNSVSIFLQIPMYVLITAGEVMFSVTGLEFAYSQAPVSMKAMCQAAWLLTVAGGNFIVLIIAESSAFENRALEFFFFAILIGAITFLFAIMSFFYKYVSLPTEIKNNNFQPKDESTALITEDHDSNTGNASETDDQLDNKNEGYHSESGL